MFRQYVKKPLRRQNADYNNLTEYSRKGINSLHLISHITHFVREIYLSSLAPDSNDQGIYDFCL